MSAVEPIVTSTSKIVMGLAVVEIGLLSSTAYLLSQLLGSADTSNDLAKVVIPVIGCLGGIVVLHTLLWYLYSTYYKSDMNLYFLVATSVSLILSLTSLSVAITTRS